MIINLAIKKMEIKNRISAIRNILIQNKFDAIIIPSTDPHISEYVAEHWKEREWISGFNGSAGIVVVTKEKAGLWTDSRYFIQAEKQLAETGIELFKQFVDNTPDYDEWLIQNLPTESVIALNGKNIALNQANALKNKLAGANIKLDLNLDLIDQIWSNRPDIPTNKIIPHNVEYTGKSKEEKITRLQQIMFHKKIDYLILGSLDDIAWLINMRGNDISYNPVFISYFVLSADSATLFIDPQKTDKETLYIFEKNEIQTKPYSDFFNFLTEMPENTSVMLDGNKINYHVVKSLPANTNIVNEANPTTLLKAIKNKTEIKGFKNALLKDGIALVKFFFWLENNVGKEKITELTISDKLVEYRSKEDHFIGESFNTIAGYREHGAIVHYSATKESASEIIKDGFLLIDSGAQFIDGTTDITRTIHLGKPTKQEMTDYTLVLKGHIQLAMAIFPEDTKGYQLDILARQALLQNRMNYGHGTGHGIGSYLNVHEGPQSISQRHINQTIEAGMITSNEPGLYRTGEYGIRIENLILSKNLEENEFGKFMCFETITLCPIDTNPVLPELLSNEEKNWLNQYHKTIFDQISKFLNAEENNWLKEKTNAI